MRLEVGRENSTVVELHVEDLGFGPAVLLLHGWPNSGVVWERQVLALLAAGHRVVSYDRRGFGKSSRCSTGFDIDTLAEDLKRVIDTLELQDLALVGYGTGCGEAIRYLGTFGSDRVRSMALLAPVRPAPAPRDDLAREAVDELLQAMVEERHEALATFVEDSFRQEESSHGDRVGQDTRRALWMDAVATGPTALIESLRSSRCDFRDDLVRISVPTLILQGSADRVAPPSVSDEPAAAAIGHARREMVEGAPHALLWTHAKSVNAHLLDFLR